MFSFIVENTMHNNYFTEKILDAMMCKTVPIYWGCTNIEEYFDARGIIQVRSDDEAINVMNKLTPKDYQDRIEFIEENYRRVVKYGKYVTRTKEAIENLPQFKKTEIIAPPAIGPITITPAKRTTGGKIPFKDVTFIIPMKIDSKDRMDNFSIIYSYLAREFDTNIMVYECDSESKLASVIKDDVTFIFERNDSSTVHRTRYLNFMLNQVTTPVTVNYDTDVLLDPQSYVDARTAVLGQFDLVYPYGHGSFQHMIGSTGRDKLATGIPLSDLKDEDFVRKNYLSAFGHCQFFKTEAYKKYGWENENFISYGPEDVERYNRFKKLSAGVAHLTDKLVYHIEHFRGLNSWFTNPYYAHNEQLWHTLQSMNDDQLKDYYSAINYTKKYNS